MSAFSDRCDASDPAPRQAACPVNGRSDEFTPHRSGDIAFPCAMNMLHGTVVVQMVPACTQQSQLRGDTLRHDGFRSSERSPIAVGVALFATTNVDDIFLLSAFFADRHLRARSVVLGSVPWHRRTDTRQSGAALASLVVPTGLDGALVLIPVVLGIEKLRQLWSGESEKSPYEAAGAREQVLERRTHSQVLAVAGVQTVAGDNLAVYIPVFAGSVNAIPLYVSDLRRDDSRLVRRGIQAREQRPRRSTPPALRPHSLTDCVDRHRCVDSCEMYQHCFSRNALANSTDLIIVGFVESPLRAQ